MENQPIVRLSFTCNRNWEDMQPVEGGRFCTDCQKKVIDFTNKTNAEIAAYLISSAIQVCGRLQNTQLAPSLPKPVWKKWLSAAAMFVAVFIGIKEASAQKVIQKDSLSNQSAELTSFGGPEVIPHFPGGESAFQKYLGKNLRSIKGVTGRVITSFIIEKDGSLTNIQVLKGLTKDADSEAIRVIKASQNWLPGVYNGQPQRKAYTMPINF